MAQICQKLPWSNTHRLEARKCHIFVNRVGVEAVNLGHFEVVKWIFGQKGLLGFYSGDYRNCLYIGAGNWGKIAMVRFLLTFTFNDSKMEYEACPKGYNVGPEMLALFKETAEKFE